MLEYLSRLLESDFMPHGYCFGWKPDILWLHVTSDALIALSYLLIPFTLIYLLRVRRDLDFRWMAGLFGLFILSCGATHVLGIVTLWHPVYRLEGLVKAITAAASLPTAVLLIWLTPQAIALPSPRQLQAANAEVLRLNAELERRVDERTAALVQAEQRYRQLFDLNPLPMWVREPEGGRFLAVNPAAIELYGYAEQEFLSITVDKLVPGGEAPRQMEDMGRPVFERHARKSGPPIYAEVRFRELLFGSQPAWLVLSTDITERKALEDQLRHSQKMEAVGRLAGGIAHDFNNLLTVILGYATVVQDKLEPESPVRRMVSEIQRSGEQAASLTGQLLTFSRKQVTQLRVLDLNDAVRGMKEILHRLMGEDVDIAVILQPEPCLLEADAGQLSQIIMNLAVNARDAMPNRGSLTIETHSLLREREDLGRHNVRPAGRYSLLVVTDNGAGMDAETQTHIFEPFFTTKEAGKGTGLGLSTVYGIVVQHRGWIDVYSEPGHGTTFRIYFPETKPALEETAHAVAEPHVKATATILVVEDQKAVRRLAEEVLTEAGHRVLSAPNGRAALKVAEQHLDDIDLLVTDVVMPEMNGPELADHLSRLRPGLIVLYVSGYTDHALLHRGVLESGTAFLQKPFLPDALRLKVEELLRNRDNGAPKG
jgi:two-component system cell cycle sensor histidine kinase/response regulator CckA